MSSRPWWKSRYRWSSSCGVLLLSLGCTSDPDPASADGGQTGPATDDSESHGDSDTEDATGSTAGTDSASADTRGTSSGVADSSGDDDETVGGEGTVLESESTAGDASGAGTQDTLIATAGSGGETESADSEDGTPEVCSFTLTESVSEIIPTVGVVAWSTDLAGVTDARIDFELVEPRAEELNVGSGGPISATEPNAFVLGMKPEREYTYRITVTAGQTVCVSPDRSLTTGSLDTTEITRTPGPAADVQDVGFILTCGYTGGRAVIIDADGQVVWSVSSPGGCSRAHMDWDGRFMWMMRANPAVGSTAGGNEGQVVRVRMDGTEEEEFPGFERVHHDFAVLPGGTAAFLMVVEGDDSGIVERAPDGTLTTIVVLNESSYLSGGTSTHPNALRYYERSNSYTVSDLDVSSVIHFDRQGEALWQVGGYCGEPVQDCASMSLTGTHGHEWLENGNLLVLLAGIGRGSTTDPTQVVEYGFDGSMTAAGANLDWIYESTERTFILGDVERLPGGNTLITYSDTGVIYEVSPGRELVQSLASGGEFGYSSFRKTLYGPPQ